MTWPGPVVYHPSSPLKAIQARAPGAQVIYHDGLDPVAAEFAGGQVHMAFVTGLDGAAMVQAGRIYANDTNTESADGHTVFNLSASQRWAVRKGALTAYARINNVGDEHYVGSVIVNDGNSRFFEPGLGRKLLVGLEAQRRF